MVSYIYSSLYHDIEIMDNNFVVLFECRAEIWLHFDHDLCQEGNTGKVECVSINIHILTLSTRLPSASTPSFLQKNFQKNVMIIKILCPYLESKLKMHQNEYKHA